MRYAFTVKLVTCRFLHCWKGSCKQEDRVVNCGRASKHSAPIWKKNPKKHYPTRASQSNFYNLTSDHDENRILPLKLSWKITSDNLSCLQRKHYSVEADLHPARGFGGHHSGSAKVSEHQEHPGVSAIAQQKRLRPCVSTLASTADLRSCDDTLTIIQSDFMPSAWVFHAYSWLGGVLSRVFSSKMKARPPTMFVSVQKPSFVVPVSGYASCWYTVVFLSLNKSTLRNQS